MTETGASLARAAEVIRLGGVVAYPTEACFGLGCDPRNREAVRRILAIKRRPRGKGLILIADDRRRLRFYVDCPGVVDGDKPNDSSASSGMRAAILDSWPGPHTWLLPAAHGVSRWLRGDFETIAVRVTAHRPAARLCRLARTAIVSTSANRSGRRMLQNADAVRREFAGEVDFIVTGRIGNANAPSIIRDGASGEVVRG